MSSVEGALIRLILTGAHIGIHRDLKVYRGLRKYLSQGLGGLGFTDLGSRNLGNLKLHNNKCNGSC